MGAVLSPHAAEMAMHSARDRSKKQVLLADALRYGN